MIENPLLLDVPEQLETDRLILRPPRAGDGVVVNAAVHESLAELRLWMPWAAGDVPVEETETFCRKAAAQFTTREQMSFFLFLRKDTSFVGACSLHNIDWKVPAMEIGYWCRTSMVGRGYVSEAVVALTKLASRLGAVRIEIRCDELNAKSRKTAERSGFELECIRRSDARGTTGKLRNSAVFVVIPSRQD